MWQYNEFNEGIKQNGYFICEFRYWSIIYWSKFLAARDRR